MAVHFDDWTLSGLTGMLEWTVVPSTTASLLDASHISSSGALQQARFYTDVFTELTPTVLTGRSAASADSALVVYATVASLFGMEKIGPCQIRVQQAQCGVPGAYRLLYLTAPTEVICNEWWRALHRLTYYQRVHSASADEKAAALSHPPLSPEDANVGDAADASVSNFFVAPDLVHSEDISDMACVQRLLLSTLSSPCSVTTRTGSYNLRHNTPSPLAVEPHADHLRTSLPLPHRQPLAHGTSMKSTETHFTATLLPSDIMRAHDTAAAAASADTGTPSSLPQHGSASAITGADLLSMKKGIHSESPMDFTESPLAQLGSGDRKKSLLPGRPIPTSPAAPPFPSKNSMLSTLTARRLLDCIASPDVMCCRSDARSPTDSDPIASPPATCIPRALAEGIADFSFKTRGSERSARLRQINLPAAETVLALSSKVSHSETFESNNTSRAVSRLACPLSAILEDDLPMYAAAASALETSRFWSPPEGQRLCVSNIPRQTPPRARSALIGGETATLQMMPTSSDVATLARVSAAAHSSAPPASFVYEPIRVETTTVPRVDLIYYTPPWLRLTSRSSDSQAHARRLHRCCASLVPHIMYYKDSPLRHAREANTSCSRDPERRKRLATAACVPRRRSCNAFGSSSSDNSGVRCFSQTRGSCQVGATDKPATPQRLEEITKPHFFVKHSVKMPSARGGGGDGSRGDGVPTYVFVTMDNDCVVAVPAARFMRCVERAGLLDQHKVLGYCVGVQSTCSHIASPSIGVRSLKRAQRFFGKAYCKQMQVAEVVRVSRGNEAPLIFSQAEQRERFHDLSKVICIATQTHAFLLEATDSAEARSYVIGWRKYLQGLRITHRKASPRRY